MTTRSRKSLRWSRFLPVLAASANDNDVLQQTSATSFSDLQARRWHAFEASRERYRAQFEAAEAPREHAHRAREDAFRAFMAELHSTFLSDEEERVQEYDTQENMLEETYRQAESQRERDFAEREARRDRDFEVTYSACMAHAKFHADLRASLFSQQERENEVEWTSLEHHIVQKYESIRMSLNMELASLAAEHNRPMSSNIPPASIVSSDDLHIQLQGTKSISPVLLPRGLPDEDAVPERPPQFLAPILSYPKPNASARQPPPSMSFPQTEPISPVFASSPSRRERSPPRVYSSTEPHASTHMPSRSPSPAPEMPPMPDVLGDFPEPPSSLPQSAQFTLLLDRQATVFASDEGIFRNHFAQVEAERENAEAQRSSFFMAAEAERERWFRSLEEQREARSADGEFARRGGEDIRWRTFTDTDSQRTWRCHTAQLRFQQEYEAANRAHVDVLVSRQVRMMRLIEAHKHVVANLRTRIAVLRTGVQTPAERPHYGQPAHELRARGPPAHAPRPPPPPPPPHNNPHAPPPPQTMPMPEPRSASPVTPRHRTWPDPNSPTSSRARKRDSRARWRSSFYLPDAVEFVPSAILKRPMVRVALPIISHTADVTMVYNSNNHHHHHHHSSSGKDEQHSEKKKTKKRRSIDLGEKSPDELFQQSLDRHTHAFQHGEQQRADVYNAHEATRVSTFGMCQAQRNAIWQAAVQDRAHIFTDGQRARLAAGRAEEARRRAAASEWEIRRAAAFGQAEVAREARWRGQTEALHDEFVKTMLETSENLLLWRRDVMIEYESDMPLAKASPVH